MMNLIPEGLDDVDDYVDYDDEVFNGMRFHNLTEVMKKPLDCCYFADKHREAPGSICNLRYKAPKEILVIFHNGLNYDYHFIIKKLAEEFHGLFQCPGENRKVRKWKDQKVQNKNHGQCKNYCQLFVKSD